MRILEKIVKNGKSTIVLPKTLENVSLAGRNISKVSLAQANLLNTYKVLNAGKLILMEESVEKLKEVFLK